MIPLISKIDSTDNQCNQKNTGVIRALKEPLSFPKQIATAHQG